MSVTDTAKERVKDWISSALGVGSYVTVDWTIIIGEASTSIPSSTIKLGRQRYENFTYGRSIPETGTWMIVPVTVQVSDYIDRQYHDEHPQDYSSMDWTDTIVDYLYSMKNDESEKELYNIYNIININVEQKRGRRTLRNRRLSTYSISFELLIKWED
jgi:hypothetical protein